MGAGKTLKPGAASVTKQICTFSKGLFLSTEVVLTREWGCRTAKCWGQCSRANRKKLCPQGASPCLHFAVQFDNLQLSKKKICVYI